MEPGENSDGNITQARIATSLQAVDAEPFIYNASSDKVRSISRKKRKIESKEPPIRTIKSSKRAYNDAYRELLNSTIESATSADIFEQLEELDGDGRRFTASQVGVSIWTVREKLVLFEKLKTLGSDEIVSLADAIGTKSSSEVRDYLLILQEALQAERHAQRLLQPDDIPAALEISNTCETVLEEAADALATYQLRHEDRVERKRHGKFWLLDQIHAKDFEFGGALDEDESNAHVPETDTNMAPDTDNIPPLLKLGSWLELSNRIFMNSVDCDLQPDEPPSMYCTAFEDFRHLAVSTTTRIVHAAMFQATSRLRAQPRSRAVRGGEVKQCDVAAAIDALGLQHSAHEFWALAARRNELTVIDVRARGAGKFERGRKWEMQEMQRESSLAMPYDEVEARLLQPSRSLSLPEHSDDTSESCEPTQSCERENEREDRPHSEAQTSPKEDNSTVRLLPALSYSAEDFEKLPDISSDDSHDAQYEQYLEEFDQRQSTAEELHLWKLLGEDPPNGAKGDKMKNREPLKPPRAKPPSPPRNWRNRVQYRAEWERHGEAIDEDTFHDLRPKSRDRSQEASENSLRLHIEDEVLLGNTSEEEMISATIETGNKGSPDGGDDSYTESFMKDIATTKDKTSNTRARMQQVSSPVQEPDSSRMQSMRPRKPVSYIFPPTDDERMTQPKDLEESDGED